MQENIIAVSVLGEYLKRIIDAEEMLYNIKVYGEISSYNVSNGNAYFIIKDEKAILNCVSFNAFKNYIPMVGDKVILTGTPKYYVKGGKLSFNVVNIEEYGKGDIYNQILLLKEKLEKEGLFDIAHKKQLPENICKIGVVTAENGAVIHDILNVATRRNKNIKIVLYPTKVQGQGASIEIAKGIEFFSNSDVDAVIVCRGGGSEEDLAAFNEEIVVRSAYNCKKFLVSAVGHETNYTLLDYVADLRAPTPSAAAELLVKETVNIALQLTTFKKQIKFNLKKIIDYYSLIVQNYKEDFVIKIKHLIYQKESVVANLMIQMKNKNPITILEKGFAIIYNESEIINSIKKVNKNDELNITLKDGSLKVEVVEINE